MRRKAKEVKLSENKKAKGIKPKSKVPGVTTMSKDDLSVIRRTKEARLKEEAAQNAPSTTPGVTAVNSNDGLKFVRRSKEARLKEEASHNAPTTTPGVKAVNSKNGFNYIRRTKEVRMKEEAAQNAPSTMPGITAIDSNDDLTYIVCLFVCWVICFQSQKNPTVF